MKTLTVAFDVQLNENEDWIKEGTVLLVSDNPFHMNRFHDATPVIITEAYNYNNEKITLPATVEWFMDTCFVEYERSV